MNRNIITFTANEQALVKTGGLDDYASNTVSYIVCEFELGDSWEDFDSVRAVFSSDFETVPAVLAHGSCLIPFEVLRYRSEVKVNLVGSVVEAGTLVDRLTSFPITALTVTANAELDNTIAPISPTEFEEFVAMVRSDADRSEAGATSAESSAETATAAAQASEASALRSANSATDAANSATASANSATQAHGYAQNASESATSAENSANDAEAARDEIRAMRATATTLSPGSAATANYSNGLLSLGIPRGDKGETGDTGARGETGATPNLSIGTVTTLPPSGSSAVTITGTAENPVLNFGLVKGDTGEVSQAELDEAVTALKSDIKYATGSEAIAISVKNKYLKIVNGSIDVNNPQSSSTGYGYVIVPCSEGDTFVVNGVSATNEPMAWAFTDDAYAIITKASSSEIVSNYEVTAPQNASYLIIHDKSPYRTSYRGIPITEAINAQKNEISGVANVAEFNMLDGATWELGTISYGQEATSTTRIRTKSYIEIGDANAISVSINTGYKYVIAWYGANGAISQTSFSTASTDLTVPVDATKFKVVVAKTNDATANISYGNEINISGSFTLLDIIGDINSSIEALCGFPNSNSVAWEHAKISAYDGTVTTTNNRYKTAEPLPIWVKSVLSVDGYSFGLFAYNESNYIGWWDGSAWATADLAWKSYIKFSEDITKDRYDLYVVFRKNDNANLSSSDIANIKYNNDIATEPTDYVVDCTLQKKSVRLNRLGELTYHQSFCKYDGKYYSTDGEHIGVQDENFNAVSSVALSVGHGNGFCVGSSNKGYISGWSDQKLYVVNLDTLELDSVITLPTIGYTTCAVDDVNGLVYIFQRDDYPSTKAQYNLIVYDYINEEIKSTVKTSVAYAAMQSVDLYRDRLIVLYGTGISEKPNAYLVYSTKGEILGEYVIGSKDTIEPEGVFFDREDHDLLISYYDKSVYRVSLA